MDKNLKKAVEELKEKLKSDFPEIKEMENVDSLIEQGIEDLKKRGIEQTMNKDNVTKEEAEQTIDNTIIRMINKGGFEKVINEMVLQEITKKIAA